MNTLPLHVWLAVQRDAGIQQLDVGYDYVALPVDANANTYYRRAVEVRQHPNGPNVSTPDDVHQLLDPLVEYAIGIAAPPFQMVIHTESGMVVVGRMPGGRAFLLPTEL